ncbi:MAG TPA: chloride channel protein, partial [Flavitalea sp.]|nr:chloride channel protein [Flavitalea sp.]
MRKGENHIHNRIPIAVSLEDYFNEESVSPKRKEDKLRLLYISLLAVLTGIVISAIAKLLIYLINLITNLAFHHSISIETTSPATHTFGWLVIFIPVLGGLIVGLMALYGSKAIRGHGIPEAMEQILTNQSKIRPSIMYLKPLSSAISIGTGGPFGA